MQHLSPINSLYLSSLPLHILSPLPRCVVPSPFAAVNENSVLLPSSAFHFLFQVLDSLSRRHHFAQLCLWVRTRLPPYMKDGQPLYFIALILFQDCCIVPSRSFPTPVLLWYSDRKVARKQKLEPEEGTLPGKQLSGFLQGILVVQMGLVRFAEKGMRGIRCLSLEQLLQNIHITY